MKGKPVGAVPRRTEGWTLAYEWLTRYMSQTSHQPSPSLHDKDPASERNTLWTYGTANFYFFESMSVGSKLRHEWTVGFLTEGSCQFHYVACA